MFLINKDYFSEKEVMENTWKEKLFYETVVNTAERLIGVSNSKEEAFMLSTSYTKELFDSIDSTFLIYKEDA